MMTAQPPHGAAQATYAGPAEQAGASGWTRKRGAGSGRAATVPLNTHPDSDLESTCTALWLESLWDRHGRSVYTLACALLGDETAAGQAMRLGMTDLARLADRASTKDAHRSWARHVYLRSQELADEAPRTSRPPSAMTSLGQLAQLPRTCLALCLFGGHTCREVASLLGVPHTAVADLLTTGLRDVERLAAGGTAAHA